MNESEIGTVLIETSIGIHKELGGGLLESVYERVLSYELQGKGISVRTQVSTSIRYGNLLLADAFRADMLIEDSVLLELKSVTAVTDAHKKHLLTYLKLTGHKLGYLLNFGAPLMKKGITRIANGLRIENEEHSSGDEQSRN